MLVSGVSVMISAVLADSVLNYVIDDSDEIVEDVDGVKYVVDIKTEK
jgi:hypothetical protein